jgi:SsrA-binding protein
VPVLTANRKAKFEYHILESYQAGLGLSGFMTKAIRAKKVNPDGAFVIYQNNRLEIIGLQVGEVKENVPLLLKKHEVNEIRGQISEKGLSCVVLNFKTVGRWIKSEIAVVKGKKAWDKRESIKKRDVEREERKGQN